MGNFDVNRAYRMIAVAALITWALLLVAFMVDAFSFEGASDELWRYRLSNISGVASPHIMVWIGVAFVLTLKRPGRGLVQVFGAVAVATTLLGVAEILNLMTVGEDTFPASNEAARIAAMTGGVVMSITMLNIVRDAMGSIDEAEFAEAAAADEADAADAADDLDDYSSPEENR